MVVYKPSAKALKVGAFDSPDERIILLGDGRTAMHYNVQGHLIQSDLFYQYPDSHLFPTAEDIPDELIVGWQEFDHIKTNEIQLPCRLKPYGEHPNH
jgi:hypothetical protein